MMAKRILVLVCILLLLVGCNRKEPTLTTTTEAKQTVTSSPTEEPKQTLGSLTPSTSVDTYPISVATATEVVTYPIEIPYILPPGETMGPDFTIDLPVRVGDTKVTGVGPAGVPIVLIDMNEPGKIWGETTIAQDGKFEFKLIEGLPSNHQVGIILGDTAGTNLDPADFVYNPNYSDRYMLGILFDIVVIEN